jgi:3-oxoadipate enol-lactonase
MLARTPQDGYIAACHAINAADYSASTSKLTLPALVIAGDSDGSTPPELVKATADMISGAQYHCVKDAAHIPCVEKPEEYADVLNGFVKGLTHV